MREEIGGFIFAVGVTILILASVVGLAWCVWLALNSINSIGAAPTLAIAIAVGALLAIIGWRMA